MNKICRRCGFVAPEDWFVKKDFTSKIYSQRRASICPMCQQEERDKRKWANRWAVKARNVIYNHAKKYGFEPRDFIEKFGWNINRIAHMFQHEYENTCRYCGQLYREMGHGLRDITLDIINPAEPPYMTNVQVCCQTCNSSKGKRGATDFGFHLIMVKKRAEFLQNKPEQLSLHLFS